MKIKSAFFANLMIILGFAALTGLSYYAKNTETATGFFGACTIVFLMLLPACSTKN
jgi:hypothetical protein